MADETLIGKEFRNKVHKFRVTVNEIIEDFNYGLGVHQDVYKCTLKMNSVCDLAIYPCNTFLDNFEPYVPKPKAAPSTEGKV